MLLSILYFCFIHLSLLLPGYVLLKKTRLLFRNPGVELCFAYLISIFFFGSLSVATYVLNLSPDISQIISWVVLACSALIFLQQRYIRDLLRLRLPLICFAMMSLLASTFIGLSFNSQYKYVPDPEVQAGRNYQVPNVKVLNVAQTQANDNYVPYRQAQFFIHRSDPAKDDFIYHWGVFFFQRTPLMGAVTANYFTMLGDVPPVDHPWAANAPDPSHTYMKFQIVANILNTLFVLPAFFLLKRLFNNKTASLACLFLVISQFFLYNAFYSWPKSLVAFFILLSWLLLLEKKFRYTLLAAVASGMAYLAHDLAVLYIGASVLLLLYNKRFKETAAFAGLSAVFALPWLLTASLIYDKTSTFIYYPFSTGGIPQDGPRAIREFFDTSPLRLLKIRADNLFYLGSPYQLLSSEGGQEIMKRLWAFGLFSIPGSVGAGLMIPAALGLLKKFRSVAIWIMVLAPVLLETVIIGWPKGLGALHFAEAITVIASGLGIYFLASLKNRLWIFVAFAINCAHLVFFATYSYGFNVSGWLTNIGDLVRLATIAVVMLVSGWMVYKVAYDRQSHLVEG